MKRFLSLLLVLVMMTSLLAACGAKDPEPTTPVAETPVDETPAPTEEPAETTPQVLLWNVGADPKTIDPTLNGASDGGDVINQTFEALTREKSGIVYPGIAESWEVS